jgi:hypothetical protein
MKTLLSLLIPLLLFAQLQAEGRQVRVLSEKVEFTGNVNTTQRKSLILQNDSDEAVTYFLRYIEGKYRFFPKY